MFHYRNDKKEDSSFCNQYPLEFMGGPPKWSPKVLASPPKFLETQHFQMVEMMGLEPIRPFRQRILSPLRLPIPPHLHGGSCRSRTGARRVAVCCLTTWLRNQSSVKLQRFIIILKAFNECNRSIPLFISSLQIFFLFLQLEKVYCTLTLFQRSESFAFNSSSKWNVSSK